MDGYLEIAKNTVVGMLKAGNKAEKHLNGTLKPFEISLQQFNVLRILRGRKGKAANLNTVQQRMIHYQIQSFIEIGEGLVNTLKVF